MLHFIKHELGRTYATKIVVKRKLWLKSVRRSRAALILILLRSMSITDRYVHMKSTTTMRKKIHRSYFTREYFSEKRTSHIELLSGFWSFKLVLWKHSYTIHRKTDCASITHFTLHLLSDWRVNDSSPVAYLRERTCELDIGAFLHKDSKICFAYLAYGIAKAGE